MRFSRCRYVIIRTGKNPEISIIPAADNVMGVREVCTIYIYYIVPEDRRGMEICFSYISGASISWCKGDRAIYNLYVHTCNATIIIYNITIYRIYFNIRTRLTAASRARKSVGFVVHVLLLLFVSLLLLE